MRERSERSAPGEQVPEAPRARERAGAAAVSDGRGGVGRGGCGAPGTTPGPGGFRAGWGSCASIVALASPLVLHGSQPSLYPVPGGIPERKAKGGSAARFRSPALASHPPKPWTSQSFRPEPPPSPALFGRAVWSPRGNVGRACGLEGHIVSCRGESHACAWRLHQGKPVSGLQRLCLHPISNLLALTWVERRGALWINVTAVPIPQPLWRLHQRVPQEPRS